ncbi:ABC transporter permease [Sedimenticola sp.]|uniref:ABC transporter permease n=1 Tax=Sedimenticola sp. TaxID=1940285 RepID=UPI003D14AAF5
MWIFLLRRFVYALLAIFLISIVAFAVIQLPPGDYVTDMANRIRREAGGNLSPDMEAYLRESYGFNEPVLKQYGRWISKIVFRGEFGYSLYYKRDAGAMVFERLPSTAMMVFGAFMVTWIISLPLGTIAAVRKNTILDYAAGFIGFLGLSIPSFILAIIVMYLLYVYYDVVVIGIFSPEYVDAPWSIAKVLDLLSHMWLPVLLVALTSIGGLTQTMRANLLDELNKPYVTTARAKGLSEFTLLRKYPVRHALNPFVSTIGYLLPALVAGDVIISIVLNLPTAGSMLFNALLQQDLYVAAGFILVLSSFTVVGTFISDILLAWLDPRIRLT